MLLREREGHFDNLVVTVFPRGFHQRLDTVGKHITLFPFDAFGQDFRMDAHVISAQQVSVVWIPRPPPP